MNLKEYLSITPEISAAIRDGKPVVALESTILSHGMPYPDNLAFAAEVERIVRAEGAVPATMAIIDGVLKVGLTQDELELMCKGEGVAKVSRRDLPIMVAEKRTGATTVASTMILASLAGIRVFAILCYATPVFFLGLMLKLVFAVWLNVLPPSGRSSFASDMQFQRLVSPTGFYIIDAFQLGDMSVLVDVLRHAVLPALALGLLTAGVFIRLVRTNVISTYTSGYVEAARSRGVSEGRLLSKHAWRPAMIPIITVMGMQIALMLAGAVLTETTFEWKGLGFMLSQYLKQRDFVAVQGIVILIAIIVAVVNFIVDVISALIDPRVRY